MTQKHTQGPSNIYQGIELGVQRTSASDKGLSIPICYAVFDKKTGDRLAELRNEDLANLIAAAPELLEALILLSGMYERVTGRKVSQVMKAIAKAEVNE